MLILLSNTIFLYASIKEDFFIELEVLANQEAYID